jgi:hypothetical protein
MVARVDQAEGVARRRRPARRSARYMLRARPASFCLPSPASPFWVTSLAAALLALLLGFAAVFHLRRSREGRNAAMNLILGAVAAFAAYGRLVLAPYA